MTTRVPTKRHGGGAEGPSPCVAKASRGEKSPPSSGGGGPAWPQPGPRRAPAWPQPRPPPGPPPPRPGRIGLAQRAGPPASGLPGRRPGVACGAPPGGPANRREVSAPESEPPRLLIRSLRRTSAGGAPPLRGFPRRSAPPPAPRSPLPRATSLRVAPARVASARCGGEAVPPRGEKAQGPALTSRGPLGGGRGPLRRRPPPPPAREAVP